VRGKEGVGEGDGGEEQQVAYCGRIYTCGSVGGGRW